MKNLIINTFLIITLLSCNSQKENEIKVENKPKYVVTKEEGRLWIKSNQLFKPVSMLEIDSSTQNLAKFQLGKVLYYEKGLSKNSNISCNSCHNLEKFGVDNEPTSPGTDGVRGGRNSPTSLNAHLHIAQFWDGRAKTVELQAQGPILNPIEMGCPSQSFVIEKVQSNPKYAGLFLKAFPNQLMDYEKLTSTIGYFERFLNTPSRFDKFLANDFEALNEKEKLGLNIYIETGCQSCHNGIALGGSMYETFGKYDNYQKHTTSKKIDNGMFDLTKNENDRFKFKVPSLRNITETYPYFHDGSVSNINEAVKIMAKIQLNKELSESQIEAIVAFLGTLKGEIPEYAKLKNKNS